MFIGAADYELWAWRPHLEVWALILAALGVGYYVKRVLAPAVPGGAGEITRKQKISYLLALAFLWLASDWPVHDISEEYLYSMHMIQHLLITLVVPPLLLLAVPNWLAMRIVDIRNPWTKRLLHPVFVGVLFNGVVAVTHLPPVVNLSASNGLFHYTVHLVLFVTALGMWMPVCGPLPSLRLQPFGKMFHLFAMSVLPTVPAGFLTFAQSTLYEAYDKQVRLWGISVSVDQQAAGLIMKIAGGAYLWMLIAVIFFRWSLGQQRRDSALRQASSQGNDTHSGNGAFADAELANAELVASNSEVLTYAQVAEAFEASPPPLEEAED